MTRQASFLPTATPLSKQRSSLITHLIWILYKPATKSVQILDLTNECKVVASIDKPRTSFIKFSPLGTWITLWETFYRTWNNQSFFCGCYYTFSMLLLPFILSEQGRQKGSAQFVDLQLQNRPALHVHGSAETPRKVRTFLSHSLLLSKLKTKPTMKFNLTWKIACST